MKSKDHGKILLVTGATSGIGAAIVQRQIAAGYHVLGFGQDDSRLNYSADQFTFIEADFSQLSLLEQKVTALLKTLDTKQVCGLICCAGRGRFGGIEEFSLQQMRYIMDVNFLAHALLMKHILPIFKQYKQGAIVVIGSESAVAGGRNGALYCASKFALRGLLQSLRHECSGSNVRVTLINPGMVRSAFFDSLQFEPGDNPDNYILPEDVADMVTSVLEMRPHTVIDEINMSPLKKVVKKK